MFDKYKFSFNFCCFAYWSEELFYISYGEDIVSFLHFFNFQLNNTELKELYPKIKTKEDLINSIRVHTGKDGEKWKRLNKVQKEEFIKIYDSSKYKDMNTYDG